MRSYSIFFLWKRKEVLKHFYWKWLNESVICKIIWTQRFIFLLSALKISCIEYKFHWPLPTHNLLNIFNVVSNWWKCRNPGNRTSLQIHTAGWAFLMQMCKVTNELGRCDKWKPILMSSFFYLEIQPNPRPSNNLVFMSFFPFIGSFLFLSKK